MEGSDIGSNVDYDDLVQEVLDEKNICKWSKDCSCDSLSKNVVSFCPCRKKNMPEAKLKSFKLLMLAVSTKYKSMNHKVRKDPSKF